ncbi:MAG TPA: hypothetical protein VL261_01375, partial [Nitrospira sp.]|nr:hypothetical protein [Nitrospira sp.]
AETSPMHKKPLAHSASQSEFMRMLMHTSVTRHSSITVRSVHCPWNDEATAICSAKPADAVSFRPAQPAHLYDRR